MVSFMIYLSGQEHVGILIIIITSTILSIKDMDVGIQIVTTYL